MTAAPKAGGELLWAKSAGRGEARGESLVQHTKNVVCVLAALRDLHPDLPALVDTPRFWHLCFWACILHDFGKAARGFQRQVKPGGVLWGRRHEVLSLAFLDWLLLDTMHPDWVWLSAAIASHHKDMDDIASRYPLDQDPEDDVLVEMVADVTPAALDELWEILTVHAPRWRMEFGFAPFGVEEALAPAGTSYGGLPPRRDTIAGALEGFQTLYRDLRHADARSSSSLLAVALRGMIVSADHQASARAFDTHPTGLRGVDDLLSRLGREWGSLHQHQRDAASARGSQVLTAPTGSGKTEAALLWASNQAGPASPPRLFYVLPFQASMNAMHTRLGRVFPPGDVGLQHGRSLHALYRQVLDAEPSQRRAEWIARREKNLAELHYHPVRVLSPYQILKACYRLRGYEAVLVDLYGGLFILDEIHAYEPTRLAMILKMFEHLRRHYGARFFVMSATLPTLVRTVLTEALDLGQPIGASAELYTTFCRHRVHLRDGDLLLDGREAVLQDVGNGQSVLVCCNTVRRAQTFWRQLRGALGDDMRVELLHSGFNARDRLGKEQSILATMAAGSARTTQVVLVATQVVEVSLNIDFDTMYSEPAPLDALLQRFGRVNRLGSRGLAPVYVFTRPDDGQNVYDAALVQGALRVLRSVDGSPVDEAQTGEWLDRIYVGDVAEAWSAAYRRQGDEFDAACLAALHAFQSDDALEEKFYEAFDAVEVLPLSLEAEFLALREDNSLDADSLLVSIRSSRYARLRREGKVLQRDEPWLRVVDVPYSAETGLSTGQEEI